MTTAEQKAISAFKVSYGVEPTLVVTAPGRVNLIGEHTDYNEGFVFPAAIDRGLTVALRATEGLTSMESLELGPAEVFDAQNISPGGVAGWEKYVAGMAWALRTQEHLPVPNIEGVVHSTVPIGTGVSSSAALEVAFGLAWCQLAQHEITAPQLAKLAQICENEFVGMRSGIMDQMASACGKANRAMFLDTRDLAIEYVPVPADWLVVLCDTTKPRALTESAYNERRGQCEAVAKILGLTSLRDATLDQLEKAGLDSLLYKRAKHVVTENARCLAFRGALANANKEAVNALMRASHESLRDDYEVSCPELDAMAEAAWSSTGCVGARMTGAGFGGACVALVQADSVEAFQTEVLAKYRASTGRQGALLTCALAEGAHVVH
jgi:galactokinase